jgi:hypothetical protein
LQWGEIGKIEQREWIGLGVAVSRRKNAKHGKPMWVALIPGKNSA